MGLLDSLADKLKSAFGDAAGAGTAAFVSQLLAKTDFGDLQGIVAKLEETELERQRASLIQRQLLADSIISRGRGAMAREFRSTSPYMRFGRIRPNL